MKNVWLYVVTGSVDVNRSGITRLRLAVNRWCRRGHRDFAMHLCSVCAHCIVKFEVNLSRDIFYNPGFEHPCLLYKTSFEFCNSRSRCDANVTIVRQKSR
jgi:hypothetical protein